MSLLLVSRSVRSSDDNKFYIKRYKHLTKLWNILYTDDINK